ncbi:MAG: YrhK family protein [Pseudomonadota bacterium]
MAHLFLSRPRLFHIKKAPHESDEHHRWEIIKTSIYMLGGLVYLIGSVFYFPVFTQYAQMGAWIFVCGSFLYFVAAAHDMLEVMHHHGTQNGWSLETVLERAAAAVYLAGALLFISSRILFLFGDVFSAPAHYSVIAGSVLFVIGACVNIMQIVQSPSMLTLQLMNFTAVSFVAGSLLFTVASVPYIWHIERGMDQRILYIYLAWQYLIGSALFLIGGVINYWRIRLLHKGDVVSEPAPSRPMNSS